MGAIASQITSLTIVYSTVYSGADQSKHQSPASLAFVWGIHRGPVNSPHKGPVTRKMFPFDDVIMKHIILSIMHTARVFCFCCGFVAIMDRMDRQWLPKQSTAIDVHIFQVVVYALKVFLCLWAHKMYSFGKDFRYLILIVTRRSAIEPITSKRRWVCCFLGVTRQFLTRKVRVIL